jgi:hypothetical protein
LIQDFKNEEYSGINLCNSAMWKINEPRAQHCDISCFRELFAV